MNSPSRGALWFARASAWTCAAFGLSLGAHVVGGGQPPSSGGAAFVAIALLWVGLLLTRRRLGALPLIATLGVSQVVLHAGLTLTERSVACAPAAGPVEGHSAHDIARACESSASGAAAALAHADHSAVTMTITHVLAAVVLGLVLARGEEAVWLLAGLLLPALPTAPALPSLARRAVTPTRGAETTPAVPLLGGVGRRGPPVHRARPVT